MFVCKHYGITVREYLDDPALNAEIFIRFVEDFKFDTVQPGLGYILYGCGPEMGPRWQFTEDEFPGCVKGILDSPADIDKVQIPTEPKGYFRNFLEINRRVKDSIGDRVDLGVSVLGPFSAISFLRGYQELLMDMVTDIDFFHVLMQKGVEVSLFIGRHCMELELHRANLREIFLVPGIVNPHFFHAHIASYDDAVCKQVSSRPIPNASVAFMGRADNPQSQREGRQVFEYYFGTGESIEVIRSASKYMMPGFPRLVSLSGRALVQWPIDRILGFLRQGLDYFVKERGEYPILSLASIQAHSREQADVIAEKLQAINRLSNEYLQ